MDDIALIDGKKLDCTAICQLTVEYGLYLFSLCKQ